MVTFAGMRAELGRAGLSHVGIRGVTCQNLVSRDEQLSAGGRGCGAEFPRQKEEMEPTNIRAEKLEWSGR